MIPGLAVYVQQLQVSRKFPTLLQAQSVVTTLRFGTINSSYAQEISLRNKRIQLAPFGPLETTGWILYEE